MPQSGLPYMQRYLVYMNGRNREVVLYSEALASQAADKERIRLLEWHLRNMTRGGKGEHRIPQMHDVEAARFVLGSGGDEKEGKL